MVEYSLVDHATAMRISARKATLHRLPRAGVRWRWGEVVAGHTASSDVDKPVNDDRVSKAAAAAVRGMLIEHGDGWYETSETLEGYLQEKHGIELDAGGQATLSTGALSPSQSSRPVADGSGADAGVQVSLTGDDASEAVADARWGEDAALREAYADHGEGKHVAAERDARQATIGAYTSRVRVGGVAERRGGVYSGDEDRVTVDA